MPTLMVSPLTPGSSPEPPDEVDSPALSPHALATRARTTMSNIPARERIRRITRTSQGSPQLDARDRMPAPFLAWVRTVTGEKTQPVGDLSAALPLSARAQASGVFLARLGATLGGSPG